MTQTFEMSVGRFVERGFTDVFVSTSRRLLPRLDYFLIRGAREAVGRELSGRGSDHDPILTTIDLP
jgi:hypothetical protein